MHHWPGGISFGQVIFRFKDSVVTQLPGFTKAVAMAATLMNGRNKDCSANCDSTAHCQENLTSALDLNCT